MRVFLTGGSGYLGGAVLRALVAAGHDVTGAVRSDAAAKGLRGATPVVGDLTDAEWLHGALAGADVVVHAASTGDASTTTLDDAVIDAVAEDLAGTGRGFVFTGGTWALGSGRGLNEQSPWNPIPMNTWRPPVIERVLGLSDSGIRAVVVSPPDLYGGGQGLFPTLADGPVEGGRLRYPGSGDQLVASVHADDIAALFLAVVEQTDASGHVIGAAPESFPMRDVAAAAAAGRGLEGAEPEPEAESRERLGPLYDAWLLDQTFDTGKARRFGWDPVGPSLLEVLRG